MLWIKILLGLAGLGIVVFFHELGHFIAARIAGIKVEAFSIGWGWPIIKKTIGDVEYRLGVFPVGGYCKMKGENEFNEAWENKKNTVKASPDSYFGVSPWKRIFTCIMGPVFNLIFAVLVLSVIYGIGFNIHTEENRIVLLSDIEPGSLNPADEAGLKTGDRILEISGRKTNTYHDVRENIIVNPGKNLPLIVDRNGEILELTVMPKLDRDSGAGLIGIFSWTDPVVHSVAENSPAEEAGLEAGDIILSVNGEKLLHTAGFISILSSKPDLIYLEFDRDGVILNTELAAAYESEGRFPPLGIIWEGIQYRTPALNPLRALAKGVDETVRIFTVSVKSLGLLFKGIDLTKAVSGPVRITYMTGEIAAEGFGQSFGTGIRLMANFLALISIALGIMNLLPLPIIDGGMILLFLVEGIRRKPTHPGFLKVYQTIGVMIIFTLMLIAVFGDILFFARN